MMRQTSPEIIGNFCDRLVTYIQTRLEFSPIISLTPAEKDTYGLEKLLEMPASERRIKSKILSKKNDVLESIKTVL